MTNEELKDVSKATMKKMNELAAKCEEKLGVSKEMVLERFAADVAETKKKLPNLDKKAAEARAFIKTNAHYKQELRSPAVTFQGIVLGASEPYDMVAKKRAEAKKLFAEDPDKAISEGVTDTEGVPLDTREEWSPGNPNRSFGKPLPERDNLQNIIGVCRKDDSEEFKLFRMQFGDSLAGRVNIPMFVPVTFRANPKQKQDNPNEVALNPYSRIEFNKAEVEGFDVMDVLNNVAGIEKLKESLGDLPKFHERNKTEIIPNRLVLIEADVQHIAPEANQRTGNKMMVLSDITLDDEHEGYTAWIPGHLGEAVDFGPGSRVVVLGTDRKSVV